MNRLMPESADEINLPRRRCKWKRNPCSVGPRNYHTCPQYLRGKTRVLRSTPARGCRKKQADRFEKHADGALTVPETSSTVYSTCADCSQLVDPSFATGSFILACMIDRLNNRKGRLGTRHRLEIPLSALHSKDNMHHVM